MFGELGAASGELGVGAAGGGFGTGTGAACPVCVVGSVLAVSGAIGVGVIGLAGRGVDGL